MKTKALSFFVALLSFSLFVPNAQARRICYYFYFDNTIKHQYEDENVRVYLKTNKIYVDNKTDQIIYVDKANSFSIFNDTHYTMFNNTVTTSGTSGSSGISVNLGRVSPYLSGITVGGSSGTYNQTTTYETRIVPVPPHTTLALAEWSGTFRLMTNTGHIQNNGEKAFPLTPRSRYIERGKKIKLKKGFVRTFDLSTSPIRQRALVTYALSEDMKNAREVQTTDNYLKVMVADSYKGWSDYRAENVPYCQPYMADTENYVCWERYKEGQKLEDWEKVGVWVLGIPVAFYGVLLMIL